MQYCWMNGEYKRAEELLISPFDHGFLYGIGFFETFRTYDGHVFLFEEHMERLARALEEYRISMPYTNDEIRAAVQRLTALSANRDGYFRLNISAGAHEIGLAPSRYDSPNVILFRKELPGVERGTAKKGVWLETPRDLPESSVRHKSHNYMNNVKGRLELPSLKEQEGIFVTAEGYVAEGITSNVFWIIDGMLFTPAIETGILPGITRAFVLVIAEEAGMRVHEGFFPKSVVEQADEVFISNAVQELVPLLQIGDKPLPGASGVYTNKLHERYVQAIADRKEG